MDCFGVLPCGKYHRFAEHNPKETILELNRIDSVIRPQRTGLLA